MFYKMLSIFIKIPLCPQLRYKKIPSKANIFENAVLGNSRILFLWQKAHQALFALHHFLLIKIKISSKM
ncbi:MAG: hypothetical protein SOW03_05125 [Campylobacter sp.]|nr:hypothetical protein [Campylobacteraceae bacterium]MDY2635700.1 hypothetical protein [Campylobacter sp.]